MQRRQQPLIRMVFPGLWMLLGLLNPLCLLAQEGFPHSRGDFSPWSQPPKPTPCFADGSCCSLRSDVLRMPRVFPLPVKLPFISTEHLLGQEVFLFTGGSQATPRLFLIADTFSASSSSQTSSAIGSGGMSVILSAPANSPSSSISPYAPHSPSIPFQPNALSGTAYHVIVIEPIMPGFENRGIETYVPNSLPPPTGETFLGGGWLSEQARTLLLRNLLVFFGVHGFKGPADLGHSGNFGFHEGVNWGGPLWEPWGWGFQLGMEALHSNFLGTQAVEVGFGPPLQMADRHQIFFTGGLFHRQMEQGMQGGVAVDLFYDHYYEKTTLCQIRSETSIVFSPYHELGYWGAYAVSRTAIRGFGTADGMIRPNDVFAVFYRRRFTGGGLGRIWTGLSSYGDLVLGLEGTVPLGTQWAIDNNFTCLFPKHGRSPGARPEESWSVSIHLVWYPGRLSNPVVSNPYHPLFYVADNSWFLVKRRP